MYKFLTSTFILFMIPVLILHVNCDRKQNKGRAQTAGFQSIVLSDQAGDRATAYTMSNKIIRIPEGLLCTWLDAQRVNRWALVSVGDGEVLQRGNIGGKRHDNHCGAALALGKDGTVHAVLGAHHSDLDHYRLEDVRAGAWEYTARIHIHATYPSLVCDHEGWLHLAFRCQKDSLWTLDYGRYANGKWSDPTPVVIAAKPGYVYWTNTMAVGPENRLHLAFANTRPYPDGRQYHGATHLYSDDRGDTWSACGSEPFELLPVSCHDLPVLEGRPDPSRIAGRAYMKKYDVPGPTSREYLQMLLSNLAVDRNGIPHLLYHNGIEGAVELMSFRYGKWKSTPIINELKDLAPGYRVHMQSSLACDEKGILHAALMLEPSGTNEWGPPGTFTAKGNIDPEGGEIQFHAITKADSSAASWLPAFEHAQSKQPALMLTRGRNAGGFSANQNELRSDVILFF